MATDIVQSLFGVTPQAYQQAQQDRADAQALQYARLSPFEQANFAIGRGATGLASALGGALGGQDPQLQMISARQAISKQIDYNDPTSIQRGVQALSQAGDTQGAMMLADVARQAQSEIAQTGQRSAAATASLAAANRERLQGVPNDIQLAREMAGLQERIDILAAQPASPERDMALRVTSGQLSQLERLTTKEVKGPGFGTDREAVAAEVYGKVFGDLTQAEKAAVNKRVEEEGGRKAAAGAVKVYPPGAPVAQKDWMDFTQKVLSNDPVMTRTSTIISDAPNAIDIIRSSTTNDISAAALPGALARLTGEGKNMSNQDVARFARTGGLEDRLVQDAVKFFTGRTTSVKKEQAEQYATALYRGALLERKKKLSNEAEQYGYTETPNYKIALRQIDEQLGQINVPGAAAPARGAVSGDLAAQAEAELARRAAGKAK